MHFRPRGRVIQVIRTKYSAAQKRGKAEIVGRMDRAKLEVTAELKKNCNPAEVKEVESWIKEYSKTERLKAEHAARTLHDQISLAAEWLAAAPAEEARAVVSSIVPQWHVLHAVLKKQNLLAL